MNERRYIVKGKPHTTMQNNRRVTIMPGESFVPTDAEIKAFGDKFTLEIANVQSAPEPPPVDPPDPNPKDEGGGAEGTKENDVNESQAPDDGLEKEQNINQYHIGGGYYDLPDIGQVRGKEEARKALKGESDGASEGSTS